MLIYGQRIRELREERGISMMTLAKAIGVSDTAVCKWENQDSEPKLSYIIKLAEYFNCSADYLIGRSDDFGAYIQPNRLDGEEERLLSTFRALSPKMKEIAAETVNVLKNKYDDCD